jgi:cell division protease FtsH
VSIQPSATTVHLAAKEDREPRTRRKLFLYDRIKVLLFIGIVLLLTTSYTQSQNPLMSWGDAFRDQVRAKWWLMIVACLEVVRQIHYLVSEHVVPYHQFWTKKFFGGWERQMSRLNPYARFRLSRAVKRVAVISLLGCIFSWMWGLPWAQAIAEAPSRIFQTIFVNPAVGLPIGLTIALSTLGGMVYLVFFFGIFMIGGVETFRPGEIKTRFTDIWGQDHVVERVQESLEFLESPKEIEARGGYVPTGLLLWGPPGTGKTLMAEAAAGETGKPYVFVDPSAFVQTFMGVAPMKIKFLYRKLRKLSLRYGGAVVFFDEADVLGSRGGSVGQSGEQSSDFEHLRWLSPEAQRAVVQATSPSGLDDSNPSTASDGGRHRWFRRDGIIMAGMNGGGGGMGTLQALLTEMNGLNKPRGFFSRRIRQFLVMPAKKPPKYRILHIFATNMPDALDRALLRPGRIDRLYQVGYPRKDGRIRTYEGYFEKITHEVTPEEIERLAVMTPGATGASIKDLVNEAVLVALREERLVVTWADVLHARYLRRVGEHEKVEFVERERHAIAIHEACHAITAYLFRRRYLIDFASIEPGSSYLGVVMSVAGEETFTAWRSAYEIDILVSLASLAGERYFFENDNSSGVSGDLRTASALSSMMESQWGMGSTVSVEHVVAELAGSGGGYRPSRSLDKDAVRMANRIETRLQMILDRATKVLTDNRTLVLAIAHALETHKTISGEDIAAIMEGTVGPKVDGRVYHERSFAAIAEEYHEAALDAHRTTGGVDIPLPELRRVWAPPPAAALPQLTMSTNVGSQLPPPPPPRAS